MRVSLLELSPGSLSRSPALTRSERGGARFGVRGVEEAESGAGVVGVEFCAQTPKVQARNKSKLRMEIFYRRRWLVKNVLGARFMSGLPRWRVPQGLKPFKKRKLDRSAEALLYTKAIAALKSAAHPKAKASSQR